MVRLQRPKLYRSSKVLGVTFLLSLFGCADEVIE
jgi:hypothetical protein